MLVLERAVLPVNRHTETVPASIPVSVIEDVCALRAAQARWDAHFQAAWSRVKHPNPEWRKDLALDATLRALGRRPTAPRTEAERKAHALRIEVEEHFQEVSRIPNHGTRKAKPAP